MRTMDRPTLERCPHCGNKADIKWDDDDVWVECKHCHARGPWHGESPLDSDSNLDAIFDAIEGWNLRDNGKREEIEKSKKEIAEEIIKRRVDGNDGE